MSSVGGALFQGNSKLFQGPLGVIKVGFKGYDLGKTTADANLVPDQDIKDIMYQQDGTKPADHVRTGIEYMLNCTFGEIKTGLLTLLMAGASTQNASALDDSGTLDRDIYESMRDTEAGVLRIASVDPNGVPSDDIEDIMNFYEAIPIVNGDLVNWGADTQRNFPVQFRIKWHLFSAGESASKDGAFGYWGDPTTEDVPAIVWPDVAAPILQSASTSSETAMKLTFNENIAFQTSFDASHYFAKVNGDFVAPSGGTITDADLDLTFPAGSFAPGDVIEINVGSNALQDTEATPNTWAGVEGFAVTNNTPST